ncbi:MAG TPA: TetR family transcriptional regulator [Candidatus Dietzia intestinipullorum]|nr:TetR family transcriptional regulator [Candidatus Dietzia merdigallinarum]HJC28707.1 TetR family transcriptional regulator [Candidatus Dietzia intestinipullorum]
MEPRTTIDDDEVGSTPGTGRPTGREGVRKAVLRAARAQVAARGPRVPLRDIAEAAGVNLGLIHRHVGRKEDLLSEVLDDGLRHGTAQIDGLDDAGRALRTMLLGATARPDYSRLLLWLALDPEAVPPTGISPSSRPANAVRHMRNPPPAGEEHLALALTVVYAWPVLRSEILDVLGVPADRREAIDHRVADLLADLVTREPGQ